MKSHIRHSKADNSTKRKIHEIINGIGRYSKKRLDRIAEARNRKAQSERNIK